MFQMPSFKPNKQVLTLVATILATKYDHIPSIWNRGAFTQAEISPE